MWICFRWVSIVAVACAFGCGADQASESTPNGGGGAPALPITGPRTAGGQGSTPGDTGGGAGHSGTPGHTSDAPASAGGENGVGQTAAGGGTTTGDAREAAPTGETSGESEPTSTQQSTEVGTTTGPETTQPPAGESSTSDDPTDTQTEGPKYPNAPCERLVTDPAVNWRDSALGTDQEIVACLAETLGRPVGYGERARGGYDPSGNSQLVVIKRDAAVSVEAQLAEAISGDDPAWIVFDKQDFAEPYEVAMYRQHCDDGGVLERLQATASECRDYRAWCAARGYDGERECLDQFFNVALNEGDLPIRNPMIGSNKTLDGRMSQAYFRFSGFALGADSSGAPTATVNDVILTHLSFVGAGHTEDHELDPDMIRATGASHDIWIHKNDFDLTGDSAFDVKVGAYDITISFNRVTDVKRATLHGSSDSREINEQITTTLHHNAFVTRDEMYEALGNTGRRVPLIRRGTSHLWNNVFFNYRKDVLSVRVGATVLWENNAVLVNAAHQEKSSIEDSLAELSGNLLRDVDDGNFRSAGSFLWFADASCALEATTRTSLDALSGAGADLDADYTAQSEAVLAEMRRDADQALVDYVLATAGRRGASPFNSPLADSIEAVVSQAERTCQ